MSIPLSNENRRLVHQALSANYATLLYCDAPFSKDTMNTISEMVALTAIPYDPANVNHVGDTLDRHTWSCTGNLAEVVAIMTLYKHEYAWPEHVRILRSIEDQVSTKADIHVGHASYQIKTATYGTGGQLFVAESELEGTADYMAYVDNLHRIIYTFKRGEFRRYMKDVKDIGGPYDRWYKAAGWFITPGECDDFVERLSIPVGVTTAFYQAEDQQIYLSNGT